MKRVFADSYYFFALGNAKDPAHARARAFGLTFTGQFVTTGWVVMELGDGMALPIQRPIFIRWRNSFARILTFYMCRATMRS